MWGDGNKNALVCIEIESQSKPAAFYYLCREEFYKKDLFAAMQHAAKQHQVIRKMVVQKICDDVIFPSEIKS